MAEPPFTYVLTRNKDNIDDGIFTSDSVLHQQCVVQQLQSQQAVNITPTSSGLFAAEQNVCFRSFRDWCASRTGELLDDLFRITAMASVTVWGRSDSG